MAAPNWQPATNWTTMPKVNTAAGVAKNPDNNPAINKIQTPINASTNWAMAPGSNTPSIPTWEPPSNKRPWSTVKNTGGWGTAAFSDNNNQNQNQKTELNYQQPENWGNLQNKKKKWNQDGENNGKKSGFGSWKDRQSQNWWVVEKMVNFKN